LEKNSDIKPVRREIEMLKGTVTLDVDYFGSGGAKGK
jgi:hypothetical protein